MRLASEAAAANGAREYRVIVIDDNELLREGIAAIIRRRSNLCVCGLAADERTATWLVEQHRPQLALLDLFLGHRDGVSFIKELRSRFSELRVIAFGAGQEELYRTRAIRAAAAYISATTPADKFAEAITQVANSSSTYMRTSCVPRHQTKPRHGIETLTDRELHVFHLVGRGLRTGRIAEELGLSRKTIEYYLEQIKQKLNCAGAEDLRQAALDLVRGKSAELILPLATSTRKNRGVTRYPW